MPRPIRFVLVLHNHQPIGNFDHVFEQAYQDSYRPFLEVFGRYESLKIALHTSGSLMEWLEANHPGYLDRLAELVAQGRIEILGGAFYEPILAMISSRDRVGQTRSFSRWLEKRLGATVRGMWVPERVWEQSFPRDLVAAGVEYTVLDDFHFKNAGLTEQELPGSYLTEDDGRLMSIFPGSEQLRYLIPFGRPQETIDYLARIADEHPNAVVVFGDDGEKFGTWPGTKKHVYQDGWLEQFLEALAANRDWLQMTTLAEAADIVPPLGKIYLPDSSYREMTEWALPAPQQTEYEQVADEMKDDPRWAVLQPFVRGGFWRNFKVRYPESNEMYSRMMGLSRRLERALAAGCLGELIDEARTELYRGQCNCAYWHGAFGGIYLPHLRNAVYRNLITADNLLDRAAGRDGAWIEAEQGDFNFDSRQEIRLANDKLLALVAPRSGGHLYELDVRSIRHNLLATLTRRPEAYHRKVLGRDQRENGECASIHQRVVFKQEGLDRRIQYDPYPKKSLVDLFYDVDVTGEMVASGAAEPRGDFTVGSFDARLLRKPAQNPQRIRVEMVREGDACGLPLRMTKAVTLNAGSPTLEVAYLLEGVPKNRPFVFAVEFNFAGMPSGADDRYFYNGDGENLGQLGTRLDLAETHSLGLVDRWLGIDVGLKISRPTGFWTFPIETVSQSEGGFELVHQSVTVQPHWIVAPDNRGRWTVTIRLAIDTTRAENHVEDPAVAAPGRKPRRRSRRGGDYVGVHSPAQIEFPGQSGVRVSSCLAPGRSCGGVPCRRDRPSGVPRWIRQAVPAKGDTGSTCAEYSRCSRVESACNWSFSKILECGLDILPDLSRNLLSITLGNPGTSWELPLDGFLNVSRHFPFELAKSCLVDGEFDGHVANSCADPWSFKVILCGLNILTAICRARFGYEFESCRNCHLNQQPRSSVLAAVAPNAPAILSSSHRSS